MQNASVGKDAKYQEEFEVMKLLISKVHEPEQLPGVAGCHPTRVILG